jgi:response regulator NasT
MAESLRIVVVAPDLAVDAATDEEAAQEAERSRSLRIGLLENGFNLIATLPADVFLAERISQLQPDLIIVDAESGARDALEHVVMATRDERRPIVLFTNDNDTSHVKDAVAAGVSAYIVAGLESERIRPSSTSRWPASSTNRPCARNWPKPAPSCRTARSSTAPRAS